MQLPRVSKAVFVFTFFAQLGVSAASAAPRQNKPAAKQQKEPKVDPVAEHFLEEGAMCPIEGDACVAPTDSRVFGYKRPGHYLPIGKVPGRKCQARCLACARLPAIIAKHCKSGHCDKRAQRLQARCQQKFCRYMPPHRHDGPDIGFGKAGSLVKNSVAGVVAMVRHDPNTSTGRLVVVSASWKGKEYTFWYMHLGKIASDLACGKRIEAGDPIGTIGASGTWGSAPHLHFSLRGPLNSKEYHDPTAIVTRGVQNFMRFTIDEVEMAPEVPEKSDEPVPEAELEALAANMEGQDKQTDDRSDNDESPTASPDNGDDDNEEYGPRPEPQPKSALAQAEATPEFGPVPEPKPAVPPPPPAPIVVAALPPVVIVKAKLTTTPHPHRMSPRMRLSTKVIRRSKTYRERRYDMKFNIVESGALAIGGKMRRRH